MPRSVLPFGIKLSTSVNYSLRVYLLLTCFLLVRNLCVFFIPFDLFYLGAPVYSKLRIGHQTWGRSSFIESENLDSQGLKHFYCKLSISGIWTICDQCQFILNCVPKVFDSVKIENRDFSEFSKSKVIEFDLQIRRSFLSICLLNWVDDQMAERFNHHIYFLLRKSLRQEQNFVKFVENTLWVIFEFFWGERLTNLFLHVQLHENRILFEKLKLVNLFISFSVRLSQSAFFTFFWHFLFIFLISFFSLLIFE